jgi:hypothetical protein
MKNLCAICGGRLTGATYTARDDRDMTKMVRLPGTQCTMCGSLEPDKTEIAKMEAGDVPPSVRMRCGLARRAG